MTAMTTSALTPEELAESGLVSLCCGECRANAGLLPLPAERIADHTGYYCPLCYMQWNVTNPPVDLFLAITGIITVTYLFATFVGSMLAATFTTRYQWHWTRDDSVAASLWLGIPLWLALTAVSTVVLHGLNSGLHWVWIYLTGEPEWSDG